MIFTENSKKPKTYFLFGGGASSYYYDNSNLPIKEIANKITEDYRGDYQVFEVYDTTTAQEILSAYDGWMGFVEIPEDLWTLLVNWKDLT